MPAVEPTHRTALLDWLACAAGGMGESAAAAARAAGEGAAGTVAALGAAGHVLDFDDTYLPGLAHLSAPTAPAALGLGAAIGASVGDVRRAHAAGFEAMAAVAQAGHPALYERGWHPTAVCGVLGAAVAGAHLLGLDGTRRESAIALAAQRAAGSRSGFGSDGKALGVGLAAADGVACARIAAQGARVRPMAADGLGAPALAVWAEPDPGAPAVEQNWLKPWPCCLMAHAPLEAALGLTERAASDAGLAGVVAGREPLTVRVHPRARQAAPVDDPADGLQAKFSISYLVALALRSGEPEIASFACLSAETRALAATITVAEDPALAESEARLEAAGATLARVGAALGSPQRPMDEDRLARKASALIGGGEAAVRLTGVLDDADRPAADLLSAIGWPG